MQTIPLADLPAKLEECRQAAAISDDALRAVFADFRADFPQIQETDPLSAPYRQAQLALYRQVAQRPYTTANEATQFDLEAAKSHPFPFSTKSTATAGQHLGAVAFLLRTLRLRPGARILEFGPGWGNTTIALAQLGHHITAVEIDPNFCQLLAHRAQQAQVEIEIIRSDFFHAEHIQTPYDAILFFECFHHCDDHLRLLRALQTALAEDGKIYFAAEPILKDYPIPWGLRMDGEALWAIGHHGWLELGFSEDYFRQALNHTGWLARPTRSQDLPWITIWEATRTPTLPLTIPTTDPRFGTLTGRKTPTGITINATTAGYALYGPYLPLPAGDYAFTLTFAPDTPVTGPLTQDVCTTAGTNILASADIDIPQITQTSTAVLNFTLPHQSEDLELRLFTQPGAQATLLAISLSHPP